MTVKHPDDEETREEVKELIKFYDKKGWDWLQIVEFILYQARRKKKDSKSPPCS